MTIPMSRRFFLGGSAAVATGTLASASAAMLPLAAKAASSASGNLPRFGPPPGVARLVSNENPYGPSTSALEAVAAASRQGGYYARDAVPWLKRMIAERNGVDPELVTLSPGSTGVLTYLAVAASRRGRIMQPDLTWDSNVTRAAGQGGEVVKVPLTASMDIDLDAMYAALDDSISMIQITNPNNPTGLTLPTAALRDFCRRASRRTLVLVDEAYIELTDDEDRHSMIDLVREGRNVAISRTFSKVFGLAGLRIGYIIAPPDVTEDILRYGLGDNPMTQPSLAAAIATYDDHDFLAMSKSKIVEGRQMVKAAAAQVGLRTLESHTNFVYVNLGDLYADAVRDRMEARDILIRGSYGDYVHWSRVSMGRIEDVQRYCDALPAVLEEMGV